VSSSSSFCSSLSLVFVGLACEKGNVFDAVSCVLQSINYQVVETRSEHLWAMTMLYTIIESVNQQLLTS